MHRLSGDVRGPFARVRLGEGAWFLNRFNARDTTPGVTKEQLEKVKAKY